MLKILRKEYLLSMHPTVPIMLALSALVMVPNYPYSVIFFYVSLSIFFTCLNGRENNDVTFSLLLPISRRELVGSRFLFVIIDELFQLVLMIPFIVLSAKLNVAGNQAGLDSSIALLGEGFWIYGLFNLVFFTLYYKDVVKVGRAFISSSIFVFIAITLDIIFTYIIPFVRDRIDSPGSLFLVDKLIVVVIGLILYIILTMVSYRISIRRFEKLDLY